MTHKHSEDILVSPRKILGKRISHLENFSKNKSGEPGNKQS